MGFVSIAGEWVKAASDNIYITFLYAMIGFFAGWQKGWISKVATTLIGLCIGTMLAVIVPLKYLSLSKIASTAYTMALIIADFFIIQNVFIATLRMAIYGYPLIFGVLLYFIAQQFESGRVRLAWSALRERRALAVARRQEVAEVRALERKAKLAERRQAAEAKMLQRAGLPSSLLTASPGGGASEGSRPQIIVVHAGQRGTVGGFFQALFWATRFLIVIAIPLAGLIFWVFSGSLTNWATNWAKDEVDTIVRGVAPDWLKDFLPKKK